MKNSKLNIPRVSQDSYDKSMEWQHNLCNVCLMNFRHECYRLEIDASDWLMIKIFLKFFIAAGRFSHGFNLRILFTSDIPSSLLIPAKLSSQQIWNVQCNVSDRHVSYDSYRTRSKLIILTQLVTESQLEARYLSKPEKS